MQIPIPRWMTSVWDRSGDWGDHTIWRLGHIEMLRIDLLLVAALCRRYWLLRLLRWLGRRVQWRCRVYLNSDHLICYFADDCACNKTAADPHQ